MSTPKPDDENLDKLEEEYREVPEDRETLGRGPEVVREQLEEAARRKKQVTIRLDADIVARFKELAGPNGSYQTLINRALHEWLEARSVRNLLRDEIGAVGEKLSRLLDVMTRESDR